MKKAIGNFFITIFIVAIVVGIFIAIMTNLRVKKNIGKAEANMPMISKTQTLELQPIINESIPNKKIENINSNISDNKEKLIYTITEKDISFYKQQLQILKDNDISNNIQLLKSAYSSATMEKMKKIDILVENNYIGKNSKILDFGCGNGRYTFKFSEIVGPNGKVYAVDQSINALTAILCLAQSSKQNTDNIIIKINDNYTSGLSREAVDLIFISDVHIFHYDHSSNINSEGNNFTYKSDEDQDRLLNQINKEWGNLIDSLFNSTKKDGYLVLTEYMRCSGSKLRMSEESAIRLFEKHGFKFEKNYTGSFKEEPIHYIIFKK